MKGDEAAEETRARRRFSLGDASNRAAAECERCGATGDVIIEHTLFCARCALRHRFGELTGRMERRRARWRVVQSRTS